MSRDTRASTLGVNSSAPRLEQNPSGTIAQSGRQIAGLVYSGILARNPVAFKPAWASNCNVIVVSPQPQQIQR